MFLSRGHAPAVAGKGQVRLDEHGPCRREIIRKALPALGLKTDLIYHGVQREIFVAPLAKNTQAYLRGEHTNLNWFDRPASDLFGAFRERWLLPRAQRDQRYREFLRESYRIWHRF